MFMVEEAIWALAGEPPGGCHGEDAPKVLQNEFYVPKMTSDYYALHAET